MAVIPCRGGLGRGVWGRVGAWGQARRAARRSRATAAAGRRKPPQAVCPAGRTAGLQGAAEGQAVCRGWEGRQGQGGAGGCGGQVRAAGQTVLRTVSAGEARRPRRSRGGLRPCLPPPAQNGPRSYRNRKTVSAAREWWRRSGRPTTVQGVSAPVRRTVSGTRCFCARPTLRGCSTLAPCSAISSISS